MSHRWIVALAVVLVALVSLQSTHAGKIYWSDYQYPEDFALQRADLDGTNIETIVQGLTSGIAVDSYNRKVYWGHWSSQFHVNTIRRANLDGSNSEILYVIDAFSPNSIALDAGRGGIYVSLPGFEECYGILRFEMYGSGDLGDGTLVVEGCAVGVAVDSAAGKLYWTESEPEFAIRRANLDGSDIETVLLTDSRPIFMDIDPGRDKVYWTQGNDDHVLRADFDGSNQETLVTGDANYANGIALDLLADKVYWGWGTGEENQIRRADLDGSNPEIVVEARPMGELDIDPVLDGPDVPAVSVVGSVVLLLLILGVSAVALRKRTRAGN